MTLETDVKNVIDGWNISMTDTNSQPVSYSDLARPLFYGICLGITGKLVDTIKQTRPSLAKELLDLGYHAASARFVKEYLMEALAKNKFSGRETGLYIGLSQNPENARTGLRSLIYRQGTSIEELKHEYESRQKVDDVQLEGLADVELKRYIDLFRSSFFRSLLVNNSKNIAQQLVQVAKGNYDEDMSWEFRNLFSLKYNTAVEEFTTWYVTKQIESAGTSQKAADRAKITHQAFKSLCYRQKVKVADVLDR